MEQYASILPELQALRLCHCSGKGSNHIAKLPNEIEQEIEVFLILAGQSDSIYSEWQEKFTHYESRCTPEEHLGYHPHYDMPDPGDLCLACGPNYEFEHCVKRCRPEKPERCYTCTQNIDFDNCMNTCDALVKTEVNEMVLDIYDLEDPSNKDCKNWEMAIDQSRGGAFAKYDEVSGLATNDQRRPLRPGQHTLLLGANTRLWRSQTERTGS